MRNMYLRDNIDPDPQKSSQTKVLPRTLRETDKILNNVLLSYKNTLQMELDKNKKRKSEKIEKVPLISSTRQSVVYS